MSNQKRLSLVFSFFFLYTDTFILLIIKIIPSREIAERSLGSESSGKFTKKSQTTVLRETYILNMKEIYDLIRRKANK